ncbi:cell adhesion molecule CEACAM6-like isoform X5 [Canis aureus]
MEPPSASPRAGRGPWQELLLAVSLLAFWNPPTTAQVTVESVPPNAAEGKDALLRVLNLPGDTASLTWFRGETALPTHKILLYVIDTKITTPGPAYSGRETIYPNGSLLFQNITLNDAGSHILQIINQKFETALIRGQLRVFQSMSQPLLTASNTTVTEDDSVVLTCSSSNTGVSIQWLFNGQILMLTDRKKLSQDNSTLTIDPVRKEDAGKYECEVSNPVSFRKSDPVRLDVEEPVSQPLLTASNTTVTEDDSVVLTCSSSNTGISIQWLFNGQILMLTDRKKLSQDNSTLTIDPVRKEDAGKYECEVSNPVSFHKSDPVRLDVEESMSQPLLTASNTTVTEDDSVVLTCSSSNTGVSIQWLFNGQILMLTDRKKLSQDNSTLTIDPVRKEDARKYECKVFNPVRFRKSDPVRLDVEDKRNSTGLRLGSIIGIALGVLLGLALMAALGCLLLHTRSGRVSPCCDLKELRSPASTPGHGAAIRCTYPDSLPSSTAAVPMYQELQHPEKNIYCQINHKAEVAS